MRRRGARRRSRRASAFAPTRSTVCSVISPHAGCLRRDRQGRYSANRVTKLLTDDGGWAGWVRFLGAPWTMSAYAQLLGAVRDGSDPIAVAHGAGFFSYLAAHPAAAQAFHDAQAAGAAAGHHVRRRLATLGGAFGPRRRRRHRNVLEQCPRDASRAARRSLRSTRGGRRSPRRSRKQGLRNARPSKRATSSSRCQRATTCTSSPRSSTTGPTTIAFASCGTARTRCTGRTNLRRGNGTSARSVRLVRTGHRPAHARAHARRPRTNRHRIRRALGARRLVLHPPALAGLRGHTLRAATNRSSCALSRRVDVCAQGVVVGLGENSGSNTSRQSMLGTPGIRRSAKARPIGPTCAERARISRTRRSSGDRAPIAVR